MTNFDELAEEWFSKALNMKPGQMLSVPAYTVSRARNTRKTLITIQNSYLKVHAVEASKIIITDIFEEDGKWFVGLQRVTPQMQSYLTDEDGDIISVKIDPDRKRTIINMLRDGYKLEHIERVLKLTEDERRIFFF